MLFRLTVAVLRLLLNLARAGVFIQAGRFALNRSWPLDLGMIAGGWLGLISGNACAHLFRDANALHWWYAVHTVLRNHTRLDGNARSAAICISLCDAHRTS